MELGSLSLSNLSTNAYNDASSLPVLYRDAVICVAVSGSIPVDPDNHATGPITSNNGTIAS